MKSSTLKIFFNAASEGRVDQMRDIINRYSGIFKLRNKGTDHQAIYYAVKNLKKEATLYLLKSGLKLSHKELNSLISYEWYGSLASFYFLLEIGPELTSESFGLSHIDFKKWIHDKYIKTYYTHRNVDRLIKFLESTEKEIDWQKYLDEFLVYYGSSHNRNSNHVQFIRELKLRTLV